MFCSKFRAVAKRFQMHPNGKKTHQNMSSRSNCVDRERKFWEILTRLCGTKFALIATGWPILQRVLCSSETVPNAPKRKETYQNMSLGSNGVVRELLLRKIPTWLCWHQILTCVKEECCKGEKVLCRTIGGLGEVVVHHREKSCWPKKGRLTRYFGFGLVRVILF